MRRANRLIAQGCSFRSTLSAMTEPTVSCSKSCLSADALSSIIPAPSSSDVGAPAAASNLFQGRDHLPIPAGAPFAERTPICNPREAESASTFGTTTLRPRATTGCTAASAAAAAQAAFGGAAFVQKPHSSVQLCQTLDGLQLRRRAAFEGGGVRSFAASASGPPRSPDTVAEVVDASEAARRVMEDPMSRLLASQGMPVGLSLGAGAAGRGAARGRRTPGGADPDGDGGEDSEDPSKPPREEPAYQMEAFSDMLRAAAARRGGLGEGDGSSSSSSSGGGGVGGGDTGFTAGVQRVGPSLDDSWGTTRESPVDIARRIVESNMEAEMERQGGAVDDSDDDEGGGLSMALSPSEQKYASLESMSAEIKKLDEVFEVLASVPWLDEDVLSEKELKGMAQVGLLGTLEEVGFNIRPQLLRIWSGERGAELAAGTGLEFRDQAALMAILYHTQQIEDAHGPPPRGYVTLPPGTDDGGSARR